MENEWLYYCLLIDMSPELFWTLSPRRLKVYFDANEKKRKTHLQDIWLQGKLVRDAILSTVYFGTGQAPEFPQMPFKDEIEEDLAKDEEWLAIERARAYNNFLKILNKNS